MTTTLYGDGSLYGDADAIYGRVSSAVLAAQANRSRETGLRVSIIDENVNNWSYVAGSTITPSELYYPVRGAYKFKDLEYWSYRGSSWAVKLGNGDIIRVRNGTPSDSADRQIWYQRITDVTVAAQWTAWTVLYAGAHFNVSVEASLSDPTAFIVYHSKSGGLYRNNVVVSPVGDWPAGEVPFGFIPLVGATTTGVGWVQTLKEGLVTDGRVFNFYYTTDILTDNPVNGYDPTNFQWMRPYLTAARLTDGKVLRVQGGSLYFNPRDGNHGITLWSSLNPSVSTNTPDEPRVIRGLGGGGGINYYASPRIFLASDGYYYLFMSEIHEDNELNFVTDEESIPVWMRSKDGIYWSEPTPGPVLTNPGWGLAGIVESGGFLFWLDNGQVWRRPVGVLTYDVSNYVPTCEFNLPRDNQVGEGNLVVCNPEGINDDILELSDREIVIEPGIKISSGSYEFAPLDRFWIKKSTRQVSGKANRIDVNFGNIWSRLDNPLRDVLNFVGKTSWEDFIIGGTHNQPFNYFFATATNASIVSGTETLELNGLAVLTAWKGHNFDVQVQFGTIGSSSAKLIGKYIDSKNYIYLEMVGTTVRLRELVDGVTSTVASSTETADVSPSLRLVITFNHYAAYLNGTLLWSGYYEWQNPKPGYCGFDSTESPSYRISAFKLYDWEKDLTIRDLILTALAMGDLHSAEVSDASSKAYALTWGPQTDVTTPAAALAQMLQTEKLQLIWRNNRISIGRFDNNLPVATLQDTVIETEEIDEGNRRINVAVVDGNEHSWISIDATDLHSRGRPVNAYFDLPELLDQDSVTARAHEEIKRGSQGNSPGGRIVFQFGLWRMDPITWVDNAGTSKNVRIEGIKVQLDQGRKPKQAMELDTTLIPVVYWDNIARPIGSRG